MKVKLLAAVQLQNIMQSLKGQSINFNTAYKINSLLNSSLEQGKFYKENLTKIFEKYGEKDDNGNLVYIDNSPKIKEDSQKIALKEINELSEVEVDMPDIKFTLKEMEQVKITIENMHLFMPFVEDNI